MGDILNGRQHGGSPKWFLCCCPRKFTMQGKQRNPSDHRGLYSQCPASTLLAIWIWLFTRREEGRWWIETEEGLGNAKDKQAHRLPIDSL